MNATPVDADACEIIAAMTLRAQRGIASGLMARRDDSGAEAETVKAQHVVTPAELRSLDKFLASVERRAFQIARMALRDSEEALDIVQDSMLKLARHYATRPSEQWPPLFYRILNNRIRDWQRRRIVRNKLFGWLPRLQADEEPGDPYEAVADVAHGPSEQVLISDAMRRLEQALRELPRRQREAFSLRNFEGLDVLQTAQAMGCSAGSVKTHYSRAVQALRTHLGEAW